MGCLDHTDERVCKTLLTSWGEISVLDSSTQDLPIAFSGSSPSRPDVSEEIEMILKSENRHLILRYGNSAPYAIPLQFVTDYTLKKKKNNS